MRALLIALLISACSSTWAVRDEDGDGRSIAEGDCNDKPGSGEDVGPDAPEIWYDGVDQNCDGLDDYDKDGDGHPAESAEGDDCWDDPDDIPADMAVLNGFAQLGAADVNPSSASDAFYDGIDQNCDGADDFDQDEDGFDSAWYDSRIGPGTDCFDAAEDPFENAAALAPAQVHPGAPDDWYDGTDADCAGNDDYDQDEDGWAVTEECDDTDPTVYPNPDIEEIWYNHEDENCDGNDADKDGDGYLVAGYEEAIPSDPIHFNYEEGDCWDDPDEVPPEFQPISPYPFLPANEVFPGAVETWYDGIDQDCAGDSDFDQDGDSFTSDSDADRDGTLGEDCDDVDGSIYPDAVETWYDGVDGDCDDHSDFDQDFDGYDSDGYGGTDCDDTRAPVNTGVNEDCGTTYDDDCSGVTDDLGATDCTVYYLDADSDTYGTTTTECWCLPQTASGYDADNDDDCNDLQADANPGVAREVCSTSYDDDCDGTTDEQNASGCSTWYLDTDGDTYGVTTSQCWCLAQAGTNYDSSVSTDCDDTRTSVNPGATETCDSSNRDEDCDGLSDNDDSSASSTGKTRYYPDDDGDEYGDEADSGTLYCDDPSTASVEWSLVATDCDDGVAAVNPGATEVCDASDTDDDCDGTADDDDSSASTSTKTRYFPDDDGDEYGDEDSSGTLYCDDPSTSSVEWSTDDTDCNDASATISPAGSEVCDSANTDEDCDGTADNNDSSASSSGKTRYYPDDDGDEYGDDTSTGTLYCDDPSTASVEWALTATDCDDAVAAVNPGATEVCDSANTDEDCDNLADNNDTVTSSTGKTRYYPDDDGDEYGDETDSGTLYCDDPSTSSVEWSLTATDCNDASASINPGATEVCDASNTDEDCDDLADNNDTVTSSTGKTRYYPDTDGDEYGSSSSSGTLYCDDPSTASVEWSTGNTDCNDSSSAINPGATEICDSSNTSEDCDATADDNDTSTLEGSKSTFYVDGDLDTYGGATTAQRCDIAAGYVLTSTDCDDGDADIHPGADDPTDGTLEDDDCDGLVDEDDLAAGDVIFTEMFVSAAGTNDWVEVYNASGEALDLIGWELDLCYMGSGNTSPPLDSGDCVTTDTITITSSLVVLDGEYAVFCSSASIFSPAACDFDFAFVAISASQGLTSSNGGFALSADGTFTDEVYYWHTSGNDDWPTTDSNQAVQLDPSYVTSSTAESDNDDWSTDDSTADIWCTSSATVDYTTSTGLYGTPAAENLTCP